ncbi:MAG: PIN domain-containing protein [Gemmatimonas sp.]|nr:PIN domain-containing protein [Gemmatimonas sp.]
MPMTRVHERLAPIIAAGEAASCALVDLEVLFSARNAREYERIRSRRELSYLHVPNSDAILNRAIEVQGKLAKRGQHRIPIPDLIIAAAAESAGLTVLHYDADFDLIAAVTSQPVEWLVPRGTV